MNAAKTFFLLKTRVLAGKPRSGLWAVLGAGRELPGPSRGRSYTLLIFYGTVTMKTIQGLVMGLCLLACAAQALGGVNMPAFSLPAAIDGTVVTSEKYRGQAMLVTFFATWCPECLQEIPTLKELQSKFQQQGFSVVALSVDEGGADVVARLMRQASINYPVLMADRTTTRDFGNVVALPTAFLVNKDGQVVKKYPGYTSRSLLERDIATVL